VGFYAAEQRIEKMANSCPKCRKFVSVVDGGVEVVTLPREDPLYFPMRIRAWTACETCNAPVAEWEEDIESPPVEDLNACCANPMPGIRTTREKMSHWTKDWVDRLIRKGVVRRFEVKHRYIRTIRVVEFNLELYCEACGKDLGSWPFKREVEAIEFAPVGKGCTKNTSGCKIDTEGSDRASSSRHEAEPTAAAISSRGTGTGTKGHEGSI
jgi:hypothetical protein